MSFGKVYGYQGNPRTNSLLIIAKENNLNVELVDTQPGSVPESYKKLNALGKIPTFEGANGYVLSECIAIAVYLASQSEKTLLLGKTKEEYANVLRWMSFANQEVLPAIGGWFRPLLGKDIYVKKNVDAAEAKALAAYGVLEKHLTANTYLASERISAADIFAASIVGRGFEFVIDEKARESFPAVVRWFTTVSSLPSYAAVAGKPTLIKEAIKYTPPKKEKAPAAPKAAAPKAAPKAAAAEEDDEPKEAPKPKHPLEALGKPTLVMDDWKRKYSNEDTRSVALPWFWQNYKPEEYSLWKVSFKYPEELTQVFMSSNLIGGFFNRLEASRKFLFGSMSVYGVANDSIITGVFMVRGDKHEPAFDVAPDWESYEFVKLDPSNPKDKELLEDAWSWDKPAEFNGKTYQHADGKVFK